MEPYNSWTPADKGTPGFLATPEQKAFTDTRGQEARIASVGQKAAQIAVPLAILAGVALNFHLVSLAPDLDFFSRMIAIAAGSLSALFGAAMALQRTALWVTNAAMILMVVASVFLMVMGLGSLGMTMLLCTTVSWSLAIPIVNWCLGPPMEDLPPGANPVTYRESDPTNPYKNPVAQALVAGAILFSIPSAGGSLIAGLVFLGAILAITSLGSMAERTRGAAGDTLVDGRFFSRWAPICAGLVVLAIILSMVFGGMMSAFVSGASPDFGRRYGNLIGVDVRGQGAEVDRTGVSQNQGERPGSVQQPGEGPGQMPAQEQEDGEEARPQPTQPAPPPPPPPNYSEMAPKLLGMILVALLLAFLLKQYGEKIMGFLRNVWMAITAPIRQWRERRAAARAALRLAMLTREEKGKLKDVFVYESQGDYHESAAVMNRSWTAMAGAAGMMLKETDPTPQAARRVAMGLQIPVEEVQPIADFVYLSAYGLPERAQALQPVAEDALAKFETKLESKFGETWGHRKEVYIDQLAESRAKARMEEPS